MAVEHRDMRNFHNWSAEQLDYLQNNATSKSTDEIAFVLGKGKRSIQHMRSQLGIKLNCLPGKYSITTLSQRLKIPPRTLYDWVQEGRLEQIKVSKAGRKIIIEWDGKTPLLPSGGRRVRYREALLNLDLDKQQENCCVCGGSLSKKRRRRCRAWCSKKCQSEFIHKLHQPVDPEFDDFELDFSRDSEDTTMIHGKTGEEVAIQKAFMQEIGRIMLLSATQEKELLCKIKKGDKAALRKLVKANLRLVVFVAKRYKERFGETKLTLLEMVNEGVFGMYRSIEKFEFERNCRFSTYAYWWIRQAIERALVNQSGVIRKPVHIYAEITKLEETRTKLEEDLGRDPTAFELAQDSGLSLEKVQSVIRADQEPLFLSKSVINKKFDEDDPVGDNIKDPQWVDRSVEDRVMEKENTRELADNLKKMLLEREFDVVSLHIGLFDGITREINEIAEMRSIHRHTVRRWLKSGLDKLRPEYQPA